MNRPTFNRTQIRNFMLVLGLLLPLAASAMLVAKFRHYPLVSLFNSEKLYYIIESSIHKPSFPDQKCLITDHGAVGDGKTSNTAFISAAIDACSKKGGGTVVVPVGQWLTGPIHLKDNIELHLEDNSTVVFSSNRMEYLPVVFSRFEGMEYYNFSPAIYAQDKSNIAITGKGTLEGNGQKWRDWSSGISDGEELRERLEDLVDDKAPAASRIFGEKDGLRPSFVQFINCHNILIEGVTIKNGPMWTVHPIYSDNITISNVTIETDGANTDGIVIDSSRNVLIENTILATGDDAIAIKSGLEETEAMAGQPAKNIIIRDNVVKKGHAGVAIGSELSGSVRNVIIKNNSFSGCENGFRVKSTDDRAGVVENIWIDSATIINVDNGIQLSMFYESPLDVDHGKDTIFRNILISDITIDEAKTAIEISSESKDNVYNIDISNIRSVSKNGIKIKNAKNIRINNATLVTEKKPVYDFENNENVTVN